MSIKENVDYVKNELTSEEKFLENFVKGERFFKKYKIVILGFITLIIIGSISYIIKKNIDETNKFEANVALNNFLKTGDEKSLLQIKEKDKKLYEIALFIQSKKDFKAAEINLPFLKELSKYQLALANNNVDELNNLALQNDFLLKEFAIFNKALILTKDGKFEEAKVALQQISETSKASELANLLKHYLLTK
ncbi:hypothetical protein [Arcobacter aquimarinus]|uniref:Tetratricopeptide repeat-like domain-containing protein n=1 Tax=Arcobacter aquimarinus TaxID=1315211 RepID=A0AAE7B4A7_9BACT|nr:hypothetical protein [Arcobacter aquimarinus]QKE26999.1 hypothetical protein AAQM_2299 [Arcobacter aquimarinus]RXI36000.1 hypothetical protein CP986_03570 [Arcobacter aquimarinus]